MTEMTTGAIALVIAGVTAIAVIVLAIHSFSRREQGGGEPAPSETDLSRRLDEVRAALATRDGALDAQVAQLDAKLAALQQSVTGRDATLDEQVRGIGAQVRGITALFTNDRVRGGWAEIGMKRIFELGGLVEGRDFTCQVTGGGIKPDALIHLPGGRKIVIDSKFPTARYQEALVERDPLARSRLLAEQGKELERLGKDLVSKGYAELAAGGYVVMYVPSQAVYEAAAEAHPELIDRLMAGRVIIAGPSTLYALLMTVGSLLAEFKAMEQADQILEDARELHRRLATFAGHLQAVGAGLTTAVRSYNGAVGSWGSRVSPQLTRMTQLTGRGDALDPAPVEETVRETGDTTLRAVG